MVSLAIFCVFSFLQFPRAQGDAINHLKIKHNPLTIIPMLKLLILKLKLKKKLQIRAFKRQKCGISTLKHTKCLISY